MPRRGPAQVLLPGLGVASEEDAGRAVGKEDGNRVLVGLAEELAERGAMTSSWVREEALAKAFVATVHGKMRAAYGLDF
jgi:hypothetical protein